LFRTTVSYDCFVSMYEDAIDPSPRSIDRPLATDEILGTVPKVYSIGPYSVRNRPVWGCRRDRRVRGIRGFFSDPSCVIGDKCEES